MKYVVKILNNNLEQIKIFNCSIIKEDDILRNYPLGYSISVSLL